MTARPHKRRRRTADTSRDTAEFFVCGRRAVFAALNTGRVRQIWIDRKAGHVFTAPENAEVKITSAAEIAALTGDTAHRGIAAAVSPPEAVWEDFCAADAPLIALDGVTDTRNLGAVMRVARAFSAAGIITPRRRTAALTAAAAKTAAGAAAFVPLYRAANLHRALSELRAAGKIIVGASEKSETPAADAPLNACWIFGDESGGLRRLTAESCDMLVRLPTAEGEAGCLNVATAAAACLAIAAARNRLPG